MMMTLRKKMAIVLWIAIISFTLFIFLQWGLDISRSLSKKGTEKDRYVASVNGKKIPLPLYMQMVNQYRSNMQGKITRDDYYNIEEQVYSELVNDAIFEDVYKRRHIEAYPSEIIEIIKNVPPKELQQDTSLYTNGKFDMAKYRQILANPQNAWWLEQYKQQVAKQLPQQKLMMDLSAAIRITNDELQREFLMYYDSVQVEYLFLSKMAMPKYNISEAEAMEFYNSHPEEFYRPDRAIVEYYVFPIKPSPQDELDARDEANNIYKELQEGGDFAVIARDVSDDTLSAKNDGIMEYVGNSRYGAEFDRVVRKLKKNEISRPFKTEEGWHIVKLIDKKGNIYKIGHILIKPEVSYTTLENIRTKAEEARNILVNANNWQEVSSDIPGEYGNTKEFDYRRGYIPGIGPALRVSRFITQSKVGDVSGVIEEKNMYVIVKVDAKKKAGLPPYDDIKPDVMSAAADYKMREMAKDSLNKLWDKLKDKKYWKGLDGRDGLVYHKTVKFGYLTPLEGVPQFSEFYGAAFSLGVGKVSRAVSTEYGAYLIRVLYHKNIKPEEYKNKAKDIAIALKNRKQQMLRNDWYNELFRESKIIDYRLQ